MLVGVASGTGDDIGAAISVGVDSVAAGAVLLKIMEGVTVTTEVVTGGSVVRSKVSEAGMEVEDGSEVVSGKEWAGPPPGSYPYCT